MRGFFISHSDAHCPLQIHATLGMPEDCAVAQKPLGNGLVQIASCRAVVVDGWPSLPRLTALIWLNLLKKPSRTMWDSILAQLPACAGLQSIRMIGKSFESSKCCSSDGSMADAWPDALRPDSALRHCHCQRHDGQMLHHAVCQITRSSLVHIFLFLCAVGAGAAGRCVPPVCALYVPSVAAAQSLFRRVHVSLWRMIEAEPDASTTSSLSLVVCLNTGCIGATRGGVRPVCALCLAAVGANVWQRRRFGGQRHSRSSLSNSEAAE